MSEFDLMFALSIITPLLLTDVRVTVPEMMSWTLLPALTLLSALGEARPGEHFIVETEDAAADGN